MFIAWRVYFKPISSFKKFQKLKFKDLVGIFVMFGEYLKDCFTVYEQSYLDSIGFEFVFCLF